MVDKVKTCGGCDWSLQLVGMKTAYCCNPRAVYFLGKAPEKRVSYPSSCARMREKGCGPKAAWFRPANLEGIEAPRGPVGRLRPAPYKEQV